MVKPNDYKVEQQATPNMTVKVNTGEAYVPNPAGTMLYNTSLDASANVTIAANASGNPRIDAIVIKVDLGTTPNNLANNVASVVAVQGTPAASPSAPLDSAIQTAVGASNPFYRLANVTVANGASSITDANIASTREGVVIRIVGGYLRYNLSTGKLQFSNDGTTFTDMANSSKILQVISGSHSTQVSNTTTTLADTGLSATITPTSASNMVKVTVSMPTNVDSNGLGGKLVLLRGATQIHTPITNFGYPTAARRDLISFTYIDSPATTSSRTYKVQFGITTGSGTIYAQADASPSTIVLEEVAP